MANNIGSIVTNDETRYRTSLYTALQYSGLVTSSMTFDEMCAVLAAKYPNEQILYYNGNTYSSITGGFVLTASATSYSSNSSGKLF